MQKRGKTAAGNQRWQCRACALSCVRRRPDARVDRFRAVFARYLCGVLSQRDIASQMRVSRATLTRRFAELWEEIPSPPQSFAPADVLLVDGFHLRAKRQKKASAVLIAATPGEAYSWHFAKGETKQEWKMFLSSMPAPSVVVSDGAGALLAAVCEVWPHAKHQRCMYHAARYVGHLARHHPRTAAADELAKLSRALWSATTFAERDALFRKFADWEHRHADSLPQKCSVKARRDRSHRAQESKWLRTAHRHARMALPDLFWHLEFADCPRTTNFLEGGINARLRELLRRHRGLPEARQRALAARFLASKTEK